MKIKLTYILVVFIWSTTPLAIKWSNESFGFLLSVALRIAIALIICVVALKFSKRKLIQQRSDIKVFLAGGLSLFPSMLLVYWSAQFVPSGLLSVLLGVYPFFVGGFSIYLLKDNPFTLVRVLALFVAILGLVFVGQGQMALGDQASFGVFGVLLSALLLSIATVALKKFGGGVDPLRQLTGSLLFSAPCFVLAWLLIDGSIPSEIGIQSALSVAYLVLAGSILGGLGFFYIVTHCRVSTVSLITLITPVFAILVGYIFAGEMLNTKSILGSALILVSLAIYQSVFRDLVKFISQWRGA